jgi:hypothetical protein
VRLTSQRLALAVGDEQVFCTNGTRLAPGAAP